MNLVEIDVDTLGILTDVAAGKIDSKDRGWAPRVALAVTVARTAIQEFNEQEFESTVRDAWYHG